MHSFRYLSIPILSKITWIFVASLILAPISHGQLELLTPENLKKALNKQKSLNDPQNITAQSGQGIREECRSFLAGQYINLYNEIHRTVSQIEILQIKTKKMEGYLAGQRHDLKRLEDDYSHIHYDNKEEQKVAIAKQKVAIGEITQREFKEALAKYQVALEPLKQQRAQLEQLLQPIFEISHKNDLPGYGVSFAYRNPCGTYQWICPLPEKQRTHLVTIMDPISKLMNQEIDISCRRYAEMQATSTPIGKVNVPAP